MKTTTMLKQLFHILILAGAINIPYSPSVQAEEHGEEAIAPSISWYQIGLEHMLIEQYLHVFLLPVAQYVKQGSIYLMILLLESEDNTKKSIEYYATHPEQLRILDDPEFSLYALCFYQEKVFDPAQGQYRNFSDIFIDARGRSEFIVTTCQQAQQQFSREVEEKHLDLTPLLASKSYMNNTEFYQNLLIEINQQELELEAAHHSDTHGVEMKTTHM